MTLCEAKKFLRYMQDFPISEQRKFKDQINDAFDVFYVEPPSHDEFVSTMDDVMLTAHILYVMSAKKLSFVDAE